MQWQLMKATNGEMAAMWHQQYIWRQPNERRNISAKASSIMAEIRINENQSGVAA
jgi:hypothetical protein